MNHPPESLLPPLRLDQSELRAWSGQGGNLPLIVTNVHAR